jgi:uncharacterized membrane protein YkvA (DUF1232 family)
VNVLALAKRLIRRAGRDAMAAWLAARDPRTPWLARMAAAAVAAYAFSPIDLIPDFVPVLGLLDDLVILPLGVAAVAALTPRPLWAELRAEAERRLDRPSSRLGAVMVVALWLSALAVGAWLAFS